MNDVSSEEFVLYESSIGYWYAGKNEKYTDMFDMNCEKTLKNLKKYTNF